MSRKTSRKTQIGERLHEERRRLGRTQVESSRVCSIALRTYHTYEAGTATPNADALLSLYQSGVDILYAVTGDRNAQQLSPEQQTLLSQWARLDERGRGLVLTLMQTYLQLGEADNT